MGKLTTTTAKSKRAEKLGTKRKGKNPPLFPRNPRTEREKMYAARPVHPSAEKLLQLEGTAEHLGANLDRLECEIALLQEQLKIHDFINTEHGVEIAELESIGRVETDRINSLLDRVAKLETAGRAGKVRVMRILIISLIFGTVYTLLRMVT